MYHCKTGIIMDVVFRVDKGGVFALFPHDVADHYGNVTTYQHVGQHSVANYRHCIDESRPATEEEYKDLKKELESIGYKLNVVKRQIYKKWLESYGNLG